MKAGRVERFALGKGGCPPPCTRWMTPKGNRTWLWTRFPIFVMQKGLTITTTTIRKSTCFVDWKFRSPAQALGPRHNGLLMSHTASSLPIVPRPIKRQPCPWPPLAEPLAPAAPAVGAGQERGSLRQRLPASGHCGPRPSEAAK